MLLSPRQTAEHTDSKRVINMARLVSSESYKRTLSIVYPQDVSGISAEHKRLVTHVDKMIMSWT